MNTSSQEQFIKAWQEASTGREAAEKLDISLSSAIQRATYLRKKGVPLKMFKQRLDYKALAELALRCKQAKLERS